MGSSRFGVDREDNEGLALFGEKRRGISVELIHLLSVGLGLVEALVLVNRVGVVVSGVGFAISKDCAGEKSAGSSSEGNHCKDLRFVGVGLEIGVVGGVVVIVVERLRCIVVAVGVVGVMQLLCFEREVSASENLSCIGEVLVDVEV